jgi:hypothetical protein
MLNAKVGSSVAGDAYRAGKEAAAKAAVAGAKVAFVYSSCDYDQEAMLKGVGEALPGVPAIGCTSFTGVVTPEGFVTGPDGYVGVMALADDDIVVGAAGAPRNGGARETGRAVAKAAMAAAGKSGAPSYFYMVAPPGEEETYLKGVEDVIGRAPFFGGSAADNTVQGKWKVLFGDHAYANGLGLAFFYTGKKIGLRYAGEYRETAKFGIITKVEGKRKIVEIDGVPALDKYASWLGAKVDGLFGLNLLGASICHPLGEKDRLGDLVAIRHPMVGNSDHTINVGSDVAAGTAVIFMDTTPDDLIASTGKTIHAVDNRLGEKAGAYLLVHCGGRRGGIGDRIGEAAAEIKAAAGGAPFIGVFTFGEYGFEDWGANTCGGLMLSFAGFQK